MQPLVGPGVGWRRALAESMGAQVAWWQLGFRTRGRVMRSARHGERYPDGDVWDVAVDWAWQQLRSPLWWRVIRNGGATLLVVIELAAGASVLGGIDDLIAVSGAVMVCLPVALDWSWRQARCAGMLVALTPASRPRQRDAPVPRWWARAAVVVLAVGSAAGMLTYAIHRDRSDLYRCPPATIDSVVYDWWKAGGGDRGVGCPAGDTRVTANGLRYTPWRKDQADWSVYVAPTGPIRLSAAIFAAWAAAGGVHGVLGEPIDGGRDGAVEYRNFQGGSIVVPDGSVPRVQLGRPHSVTRGPDSACTVRDRPCVTVAYADGDGVHVGWHYGAADAFNVRWWPDGEPDNHAGVEVAGYAVTFPDPPWADAYVVEVQACDKQFLGRSACTPYSARVIVRPR